MFTYHVCSNRFGNAYTSTIPVHFTTLKDPDLTVGMQIEAVGELDISGNTKVALNARGIWPSAITPSLPPKDLPIALLLSIIRPLHVCIHTHRLLERHLEDWDIPSQNIRLKIPAGDVPIIRIDLGRTVNCRAIEKYMDDDKHSVWIRKRIGQTLNVCYHF